jgi:hypothetical protein
MIKALGGLQFATEQPEGRAGLIVATHLMIR